MKIGPHRITAKAVLAPMSGVTDAPFRRLAERMGAPLVVSEMVASAALCVDSREMVLKSEASGTGLHVVQIAGREARWMREAAVRLAASGADIIDINMGCPARKVTSGYSGSALMREPDHAQSLIEATLDGAGDVPVTLKMRLGWDHDSINAPDIARRAVAAGVQAITIHGRTRCQFYNGTADWRAVRAVREAVDVPLTVNGDIIDVASARDALAQSGADAVMIGRGAYGQPWIVQQIDAALKGETSPMETPRCTALVSLVRDHYADMLDHYGTGIGVRAARKHLGWYLDVAFGAHRAKTDQAFAEMRRAIMTADDPNLALSAFEACVLALENASRVEQDAAA